MYTTFRKIHKEKDAESSEFEVSVAQALLDLEHSSQELKSGLKDLFKKFGCARKSNETVAAARDTELPMVYFDYDPYEEYPGTSPFIEPEAQIMRKITESFNPHIWVTVHSGMEALFMPYDHKNVTPNGLTSKLMKSVLVNLNHHHLNDRCVVGSGGGSVGYFAHGTTTDYMYDVAKVPGSFTFEIYGDNSASSKDCFKMFNPTDTATFKRVLSDWCSALLELFEIGPDQLKKAHELGRMISIGGNVVHGSLVGESRERRTMVDGLALGMQELRTYYRLFMLSSVLLMFMFCSRISKSKCIQTNSTILS